ncbi:MAG: uracil-DNA glycosylase [bacterium]|nr:uracil-DNA glycosylase [bacterium]
METLHDIAKEVHDCRKCPLFKDATHGVPGDGNEKADVFFIGEGPGAEEDKQGKPFVGAAGKFLNEMLESVAWKREDVFIGNIVKHRPPNNRDPEPEEIIACLPYLERQLAVIKPTLIVTLGRHAMHQFLPADFRISQEHGKVFRRHGRLYVPLYHPAAALYHGGLRQTLIEDFQKLPKILKKAKSIGHEENK